MSRLERIRKGDNLKLEKILQPTEKQIAIIIGLGLCLFPVHNKSLTFSSGEETFFFLPWLGFGLMLIGLICLFDNKYEEFKKNLGPKKIWIPLFIIVLSAFARLAVDFSADTFAGAALIAGFFALYVAARKLGVRILWAFLPFVLVEAVSCIIQGVFDHGYRAGGILTSFRDSEHTANYDIATCWLILGACLILGFNKGLKLWFLLLIAAALFFVGAEEALIGVACLGIAAIIRKDISKKVVYIALLVIFLAGAGLTFGATQDIYAETHNKLEALVSSKDQNPEYNPQTKWDEATTGRVGVYKEAIREMEPLGHGYTPTDFTTRTPHNGFIIIFDQIGIIAALCWLWVVGYCFLKTSWKYAWVAFIALALADHFVWTQAAPWFWVLVGLSLTVTINDRVFTREERVKSQTQCGYQGA